MLPIGTGRIPGCHALTLQRIKLKGASVSDADRLLRVCDTPCPGQVKYPTLRRMHYPPSDLPLVSPGSELAFDI